MELCAIRHAPTASNRARTLQGQRHDNPLEPESAVQAEQLCDTLDGHIFHALYCSPLKRSHDTLIPLARQRQQQIIFRDELLEIDFGDLSGASWEKDPRRTSGFDEYDFSPWGGEHSNAVKLRVERFLLDVRRSCPPETVLAMTHGGIIRMLYTITGQPVPRVIENLSIHYFDF